MKRLCESVDTVFDCVVPYIDDSADRNSFSGVCRVCYNVDAKTRKHVTVHLCYTTPLRCRQRFPFIESLTLIGNPHIVDLTSSPCNWDHNITPWIQEIATSFKRLKVIRFQDLVIHDSDLELLARTRGENFRVLEIHSCSGFSIDGLVYIGKYCNDLRSLSLESSSITEKDGEWLHELALHNTSIESLNFYKAGLTTFHVKDLVLVAKNCSQSLVSVKISEHYDFVNLVEFFRNAVNLEDFGGGRFGNNNPIHDHMGNNPFDIINIHDHDHMGHIPFGFNPIHDHMGNNPFGFNPIHDHMGLNPFGFNLIRHMGDNHFGINAIGIDLINPLIAAEQEKYSNFNFPQTLKYLALNHMSQKDIVLPFAHLITQLDLQSALDKNHHHFLIKNCPNLKVLYTTPVIEDKGLELIGQFCKNLRKLYMTNRMGVTEKGLDALVQGCHELECLHISLSYITNETIMYIGIHMEKLYDFSMVVHNKSVRVKTTVLDNGVRSLLISCNKLERLSICFQKPGGLSDVGLSYIGKYGCNLRYLSLSYAGTSDAGLVELSYGCPKLQNVIIKDCPFSKEAFDILRCNVPSLRYFQFQGIPRHCRKLLEEDHPYFKQIY